MTRQARDKQKKTDVKSFSFPEQEQQHELACDVVLDGLGRGVADGAVQRQSLAVLRDGGHLCDLNGQFIRAVDGLGADDSADHAAYAGGAGKEAEAEGEEEEESLGRTSGGGGGSSSSSSFASQLKAAAKAAAELAGVHNPAQGGLGEWRHITFVASLSWQIVVFQANCGRVTHSKRVLCTVALVGSGGGAPAHLASTLAGK